MNNANDFKVLVKPHITEKTMRMTEDNIYAFVVSGNKSMIARAVTNLYNVDVMAVRVLNYKPVVKYTRKGRGATKSYKIAYVRVKQGQQIDVEKPISAESGD